MKLHGKAALAIVLLTSVVFLFLSLQKTLGTLAFPGHVATNDLRAPGAHGTHAAATEGTVLSPAERPNAGNAGVSVLNDNVAPSERPSSPGPLVPKAQGPVPAGRVLTPTEKITGHIGSSEWLDREYGAPFRSFEDSAAILFPKGLPRKGEATEGDVPWVASGPSLPFTREFQLRLARHQNPPSCANASYIIWPLWQEGLGKDLHSISWAIAAGLRMGRVVLVNSTLHGGQWKYTRYVYNKGKSVRGFEGYFEPLSKCSLADAERSLRPFRGIKFRGMSPDQNTIPDEYRSFGRTWFRAQVMLYVFRLNEDYTTHLVEAVRRIPTILPRTEGMACLHVRRSDKVGSFGAKRKEMEAVPVEDYLQFPLDLKAHTNTDINRLYVSTEDGSVFTRLLRYTTEFNISYFPERRGNHNHDSSIKHFGSLILMDISVVNVLMHHQCPHLILTRSSNFCRLVDELRMANGNWGAAVAFVDKDKNNTASPAQSSLGNI